MLTIFSTPKAFRGHMAIIQRNAVRSWILLHPDCEVVLIGDDEGTADAARELGVRHEAKVLRNEYGTPYLSYIFDRAQELASHDVLCYSNCDIMQMNGFIEAVKHVSSWSKSFLMVGRRWDTDITEPWDFEQADWQERLKSFAMKKGKQRHYGMIDYFTFSKGIYYKQFLPFVIGRPSWDNWLIWKTRSLNIPVVDVSSVVTAVHQNHDYSHHPHGEKGFLKGPEAKYQYNLVGDWRHIYSIEDATHTLTSEGIKPNFKHRFMSAKRAIFHQWLLYRQISLALTLRVTRPVRHSIGLRQENIFRFAEKIKLFLK